MMTALSRISDNMHHETDVIGGTILGMLIAIGTVQCIRMFYARTELAIRKRDQNTSFEAENFIENRRNQQDVNLPAVQIKYEL